MRSESGLRLCRPMCERLRLSELELKNPAGLRPDCEAEPRFNLVTLLRKGRAFPHI